MSFTRVDLSIELTVSDTCSTITLTDDTADYGGSGKITVNDVTGLVITVNLSGGSYMTYTFTILNGTITAATLGLSGGTATNILSELSSTTFPLTDFDLWGDYGVTVPEFTDQVVGVTYEIIGISGGGFDYTTSEEITVPCVDLCCCIATMGRQIDPDCDCEDCLWNYLRADAYMNLAIMNTGIGNTDRATKFLTKASELCDCDNC